MEIKRKEMQNKVDINDMHYGEIFRSDNSYYIKIMEGDFQETGIRCSQEPMSINAINLETGDWAYFPAMTKVRKVKGIFVVEES